VLARHGGALRPRFRMLAPYGRAGASSRPLPPPSLLVVTAPAFTTSLSST
jgi:hypothetical protein